MDQKEMPKTQCKIQIQMTLKDQKETRYRQNR